MERIRYEVEVEDTCKTRVDAIMGKSIFEYKARVTDIRIIHSAFFLLAGIMADLSDHRGILILDETKISGPRLKNEWETLSKLIQPLIFSRLVIVVIFNGAIIKKLGDLTSEESEVISEIQEKLSQKFRNQPRKSDAFFEILRILLVYWFRGYGPLQLNKVSQLSGFSYPTIALTLEKMEVYIKRHSDRSIELKSFPGDSWFKLIAVSDGVRKSRGYWAYQPKNIDNLIERLTEKNDYDVACGGIIGARFYLPGIDLVGIPRLDLSVHNWSTGKIDKFVRTLDPGLKRIETGEIPQVVIHNIFRPDSLFNQSNHLQIADEVECLLDLYEARQESQASELLEHLKERTYQ